LITKDQFEEKVLKEIRELPPWNREKLFEIIHYFRMGISMEENHKLKDIKRFAGMWKDMSQEEINTLLSTYNDRENYFQERQIS